MSYNSTCQNLEIEASYAYLAGGLGALIKIAARDIDAIASAASPEVQQQFAALSRRMRAELEAMRSDRRSAASALQAADEGSIYERADFNPDVVVLR